MSGPIDCCTRYECVAGVCQPGAVGSYDSLAACEEACMGCVLLCDQCPDGISSQWHLTVTGYPSITVVRHGDPDDDNQCRFFSHDLLWEMSYEPGTDQWVVVNNETNVSWVIDGADWDCAGPNLLENNTDDPVEAAAVSQCYSYNCVSGGSGSGSGSGGGCVQVPGTDGTYDTLDECTNACKSYNCVGGTCVQITGPGGTYSTLGACQAACVSAAGWYCVIPPGGGTSCDEAAETPGGLAVLENSGEWYVFTPPALGTYKFTLGAGTNANPMTSAVNLYYDCSSPPFGGLFASGDCVDAVITAVYINNVSWSGSITIAAGSC